MPELLIVVLALVAMALGSFLLGRLIGRKYALWALDYEHSLMIRRGVYSLTANDLVYYASLRIRGKPENAGEYWKARAQKLKEQEGV